MRSARHRVRFETMKNRILERWQELHAQLVGAGLTRDDLGSKLDLGRSWWGMASMIGSDIGPRLVDEDGGESIGDEHGGESIGDDVGYGPACLLSPTDLEVIVPELERVAHDEAEQRFRAFEAADYAEPRWLGRAPKPCSDDEFEAWSWKPFCALRTFVRETAEERSWLLKWSD